jgi:hypothetical protein
MPFLMLNKIYKGDIQTVCENGAIVHCPGLFEGELIVMTELSRRSIIIAMNAAYPETEYAVSVLTEFIQKEFSQCILLCDNFCFIIIFLIFFCIPKLQ